MKLSIVELRSRPNSGTTQGKDNHPLVFVRRDELNKLLDIAELAVKVNEYVSVGDRHTLELFEKALREVAP